MAGQFSHDRSERVGDHRHVEREFNVPDGTEVAHQPPDLDPRLVRQQREGDRICQVGRQRWAVGPRTAITTGV